VLPRGTEYRLELIRPLKFEDAAASSGPPADPLPQGARDRAQAVLAKLPSQRADRVSGEPADLINLMFVGSFGGIMRAFQAAGWSASDRKATASILRTYFSVVLRRGYETAPMGTMLLDGTPSDIELQKSLNTFSRRHHVRIWSRLSNTLGDRVWIATATEDTGIKFSLRAQTFTHAIDSNVDAERTKVIDDLVYTGCVSEAGLIERNNLPARLENGSGTELKTDGRVAVAQIGECAEPRVMPAAKAPDQAGILHRLGASLRAELIRSNFVSLAYNGVRLISATRSFVVGRPPIDDTGATLTRQQVAWLADKSP
jgi:hypothetical protein